MKKNIHLKFNLFHPSSFKGMALPKIFFKTGSFVKYFPKYSANAKIILIIVGFM